MTSTDKVILKLFACILFAVIAGIVIIGGYRSYVYNSVPHNPDEQFSNRPVEFRVQDQRSADYDRMIERIKQDTR